MRTAEPAYLGPTGPAGRGPWVGPPPPLRWLCVCLTLNPATRQVCRECGWGRDATLEDHLHRRDSWLDPTYVWSWIRKPQ